LQSSGGLARRSGQGNAQPFVPGLFEQQREQHGYRPRFARAGPSGDDTEFFPHRRQARGPLPIGCIPFRRLREESLQTFSQEFCIHEPAGKRWLEVRNRPLFHQPGHGGKPDRTILILRDVTAQKRAEKERVAAREDGSEDAVQHLALPHDALRDLRKQVPAGIRQALQ